MDFFIGTINAKVDSKGRAFFPAPFRKILQTYGESRLIIKKDVYQDCLVIYPESIWTEEVKFFRSRLDPWNKKQQKLYRQLSTNLQILELDSSGRLLISKQLLQKAKISEDVSFLGRDNKIEVWNPELLEEAMFDPDEFEEMAEKSLSSKPQNE